MEEEGFNQYTAEIKEYRTKFNELAGEHHERIKERDRTIQDLTVKLAAKKKGEEESDKQSLIYCLEQELIADGKGEFVRSKRILYNL